MPKRLTTEDFIKKAQLKHGSKYDYSETEYVHCMKKVKIICRIHGSFLQKPSSHLTGRGCSECVKIKQCLKGKFQTAQAAKCFIPNARSKHDGVYDYSEVDYVDSKTPVKIICKTHGPFLQIPNNHLNGKGCPDCGNTKRGKSKIDKAALVFIPESIKIHGLTYDYSETEYVLANEKVTIICKIHGSFLQTPHSHLTGRGCSECGKIKQCENNIASSALNFIPDSIKIHGDTYDYSKTEYVKSNDKVTIICKIHGSFLQTPLAHLRGQGCFKCGKTRMGAIQTDKCALDFEPRARIIHGLTYDYSLVEYVNTHKKVIIICKEHGSFMQTPKSHLSGCGCPDCGNEKIAHSWLNLYEENKELGSEPGIFYLLKFKHTSGLEFIKAGITKHSIKKRYTGSRYKDFTYEILEENHMTNLESAQKEQEFIKKYKEYKLDFPENIKFTGSTETFSTELLSVINLAH